MALTLKNLGKGQMPTGSNGALTSQVLTGKSVLVESVIFVNRQPSAPATVTLYVRRALADTLVMPGQAITSGTRASWTNPIALNAADTLYGLSTATLVDFLVSGVERDI